MELKINVFDCFGQGYVTTFKAEDLQTLKTLLAQQPEPLTQAGLHPTAEQIELYAYHLPQATLSNLMVRICKQQSQFVSLESGSQHSIRLFYRIYL